MSLVKVRPKRQITLPPDEAKQVGIEEGDLLEIHVDGDSLTIRPKVVVNKSSQMHLRDLMGSAKGVYGSSPEEVDNHVNNLRSEWE